jgi:hypothetical protein
MALEKRKMETVAMTAVFEDNSILLEIEFNDLMSQAGDIIPLIIHFHLRSDV